MRFLYVFHPAAGHCNPFLPFARELQNAGHQISFATAGCYKNRIEKAGFEHITAGLEWDMGDLEKTVPDIKTIEKPERGRWLLEEILLDRAPKKMVPDLLTILDYKQFDALILSTWELSGIIAAELKKIPYAFYNYGFRFASRDVKRYFGKKYSLLREYFKLPPDPECFSFSKYLSLRMMPGTWHHPYAGTVLKNILKRSLPEPTEHFIRPPAFSGPDKSRDFKREGAGDRDVEWINGLDTKPIVYVSFGTVYNSMYPRLIRAIIEALKEMDINLVISLGDKNSDPGEHGDQPENVFIKSFIDPPVLFKLFRLVSLFLHHGGYGNTMMALAFGLPQVIIPLAGDQPFAANLIIAHGIGKPVEYDKKTINYLGTRAVNPDTLSIPLIRERVVEVLSEKKYKKNALELQKEVLQLPALNEAVGLLEKMVLSAG